MAEKIEILLNGKKTPVPAEWTLDRLIQDLGIGERYIAVEVNEEIIRAHRWSEHVLRPGDRVEIVHFVGGGKR